MLIGVLPFGLINGALALSAGLTASQAQSMSWIVFAGSSQFALSQLVLESVPALIMVLTVWVINLRHMLYSASLAPYMVSLPTRWKLGLAYLLTDEAYVPSIQHYEKEGVGEYSHWYFLGAGLALWTTWQVSTALGIFVGVVIPENWPLDFALPLTFIALVVPSLKDRPALAAALTAGLLGLVGYSLPYKTGLMLAGLAGIAVGTLLEARK